MDGRMNKWMDGWMNDFWFLPFIPLWLPLTFFECLGCTDLSTMYFTCIISFHPHNSTLKEIVLLTLFGIKDIKTQELGHLPKVAQLVSGRPVLWTVAPSASSRLKVPDLIMRKGSDTGYPQQQRATTGVLFSVLIGVMNLLCGNRWIPSLSELHATWGAQTGQLPA